MRRQRRYPVRVAILVGLVATVALAGCTLSSRGPDTSGISRPSASPSPGRSSASPSSPSLVPAPPSAPIPSPAQTSASAAPSSAPSPPAPTTAPTQPPAAAADPVISKIGDRQWARIEGTGTWRPECPVGREDLRRLDVNFVDFEGNVRRGDLIANRDTIDDLAEIFTELFNEGFPIEAMRSVEKYDGDVRATLEANNTSAFNCRRPDQINAPVLDSPHANGRAVDINPYQNPWTDPRCDCWVPSADFAAQRTGPGVIDEGGLPWRLFTERDWIWQDIKVPDFMHFDTGFPSRPR